MFIISIYLIIKGLTLSRGRVVEKTEERHCER